MSSRRDIAHIIPHISYSSLRNFVECPKRFYFSHVARLPAVVNANMVYGSAVHAALDEMFSREEGHEREVPSLKQVLDRYHAVWKRSDFGLSSTRPFPQGTKHVRDLGEETVKNFFSRYRRSNQGECNADNADGTAADCLLQLDTQSWHIQPEKSFEVSVEPRSRSSSGGSSKCGNESDTPPSFKIRGIFDLLCEPRRSVAETTGTEAAHDKVRARDILAKRTGLAKTVCKHSSKSLQSPENRVPTIVEFKTTLRSDSLRPRNWHRAHELQLKIYALAYTKLGENLDDANKQERQPSAPPQVQVVLKSVESGEEYVALYGLEELNAVEEELAQIHSEMQRSAFEARPSFRVSCLIVCVCLSMNAPHVSFESARVIIFAYLWHRRALFVHTATFAPRQMTTRLGTKDELARKTVAVITGTSCMVAKLVS